MNNISKTFSLLKKFFYESGEYVIYYLDSVSEGQSQLDREIKEYKRLEDIPDFIKNKLMLNRYSNPLYHRIKTGEAVLLCHSNDKEIISYGWIQNWKPFKKKFGWLYKDAVMFGPYGIQPDYRGLGYYGRLLRHSLSISNKNLPIVIYTSPKNINSQKGIEKVGFRKIGTYRITFILRLIQFHKKIIIKKIINR